MFFGAAVCGGTYGLALARALFETAPLPFTFLADWSGALIIAGLCAGVTAWLIHAFRSRFDINPFAPIALLLPLVSLLAPDINLLQAWTLLIGSLALLGALLFTAKHVEQNFFAVTPPPRHLLTLSKWIPPLVLFSLVFALYLPTLGRAVGEGDPFEFQIAASRLGIAHGAGYPLLIIFGWLFEKLPVGGTIAFRANLTAAFFGALAAVGVERIARRLGAAALPAFLAGFAYGVSPGLWDRATEIQPNTLNAALMAVILYLCLELVDPVSRHPANPRSEAEWGSSVLYALTFFFGLGLTNHLTTGVLGPACLLAAGAWFTYGIRNPQYTARQLFTRLLFTFFFLLLGLSLYLYLPLRWPALNHGEVMTLEKFWDTLRGGEARSYLDPTLPLRNFSRYGIVFNKLAAEYTWAGFALAAFGLIGFAFTTPAPLRSPARHWLISLILLLMYAGHTYFVIAFETREPDWSKFFVPLHLLTAVFMGLGLHFLVRSTKYKIRASLLLSAFCLIPLSSIWLTAPRVDRSQNWAGQYLGQYMIQQPYAPNAAILADPARYAPVYYWQAVEGQRPDLDIMILPDEASYRAAVDERLAAGQAVYLGRYLAGLYSGYSLRSVGPLVEVSPLPFTAPVGSMTPLSHTLASGIQLIGYQLEASIVNDQLPLTIYWHLSAPADDNYLVSLRLMANDGRVAWQSAGQVPADGLYPTNAWRPGEVVSDFHWVPLKRDLAPGEYRLQVGLFPPFRVGEAGWVDVTPITVPPLIQALEPSHLLRARFGSTWLMGYDQPESVAPGSRYTVTLYWRRDAGNTSVTALGETRSLAAWPMDSVVPQKYQLTAPTNGSPITLAVEMDEPARCGWLAPVTPNCSLPPIQLVGEAVAEGSINFNNLLLLRSATLETVDARPGDVVNVALEWQGLQAIPDDYTVFVHLVGPDGNLHGQVDYWPVDGTLGTAQWKPGQVIRDPYRVQLNASAPPGRYTVHVGMYLLATLERLPVLNADGQPVDDKVVLSGLVVK